jgi:hypothetical protein
VRTETLISWIDASRSATQEFLQFIGDLGPSQQRLSTGPFPATCSSSFLFREFLHLVQHYQATTWVGSLVNVKFLVGICFLRSTYTSQPPQSSCPHHLDVWLVLQLVLQHQRAVLRNDLETDKEIIFAARQRILDKQVYAVVSRLRLRKQARSHGDNWGNNGRAVFSSWSVPRCYKRGGV